ncbi:Imm30 family immunity protein [Isosphaeraceae bacterium EP7]
MIKVLVDQLKNELRNQAEGYVRRSEEIIGQIAELKDPASVDVLLSLLDDHAEFDELMFSIIHAIEIFDDRIFVREIIRHLPEFWRTAPRWASIIHMRIMNSPRTLAAYAIAFENLSEDEKHAVREVLIALRRKRPVFEERIDRLLAGL